jgi:hypothetical protein
MRERKIPFELHITTSMLSISREMDFKRFCDQYSAKPLLIKLGRGENINQPMLSKIILAQNLANVLSIANKLIVSLEAEDFTVKRLKVEIPSSDSDLFDCDVNTNERYFEWHAKINYCEPHELDSFCDKHRVHLSLNSSSNEEDMRFITLREDKSKNKFESRIKRINEELKGSNWKIHKQISEYCVYDDNIFHDNGWLNLR